MKSKTILLWVSLVALAACAGMLATASTWAQVAASAPAKAEVVAEKPAAASSDSTVPARSVASPAAPGNALRSTKAAASNTRASAAQSPARVLLPKESYEPRAVEIDQAEVMLKKLKTHRGAGDGPDAEVRTLLAWYAEATDEKVRIESKAAMAKLLEQQFDARQKACEAELVPLEAQVKRLRELLQKRQQARQEIVKSRLDQLLREAEGLGWPAPMGPGGPMGPYGGSPYGRSLNYLQEKGYLAPSDSAPAVVNPALIPPPPPASKR